MTRAHIKGQALALIILLATPASAATITPEIMLAPGMILTDAGFRQADDCTDHKLRVWQGGHYHSVVMQLDCTAGDFPFLFGKGFAFVSAQTPEFSPLMALDAPREAPPVTFAAWSPNPPVLRTQTLRSTPPGIPWGTPPRGHTPPAITPPVTPIPLPGALWFMLSALGALFIRRLS